MKILLIYPEYPATYWSFQYALQFISKKASFPPLGLLTIAAILPEHWEKRLIDMNTSKLEDNDLKWADFAFISAMVVQKDSVRTVINRCKKLGIKTVAGGPLFTCGHEEFLDADHIIMNEGELTLPDFINDLENGIPKHIYSTEKKADLQLTPVPLWELIDFGKYATMNIQYSRGCPFNCEFCNITSMLGHMPRTKQPDQIIKELDVLYDRGWRGSVFFVDDNFIGNVKKLKAQILPMIISWMEEKKYPFSFSTEASINLSDDDELMHLMVKAGFVSVFIGIETPNEDSLMECNKLQNKSRDLIMCVRKLQKFGFQVQGGFIVGFDNDDSSVFKKLVDFIQESGIVTAMVGLLNAPKGTRLYHRLSREGRLLNDISGDNTDFSINFVPKMNPSVLINGYRSIVETIYSPKYYYERVEKFLKEYKFVMPRGIPHFEFSYLAALFRSTIRLGVLGQERLYYWKLLFWTAFRRPLLFPMAVTFSIYGFHFRKVFKECFSD